MKASKSDINGDCVSINDATHERAVPVSKKETALEGLAEGWPIAASQPMLSQAELQARCWDAAVAAKKLQAHDKRTETRIHELVTNFGNIMRYQAELAWITEPGNAGKLDKLVERLIQFSEEKEEHADLAGRAVKLLPLGS